MPAAPRKKSAPAKTEDQLLDQATAQLFRAIKKHTKGRPLTRDDLSKQGYSSRFIEKFERA